MNNERYKVLLENRTQSSREFDRLIVYLSAGGLGLTVAFTNDLIDLEHAHDKWLLLSTWIGFTIALFANLISQLTSTMSMDLEIEGNMKKSDFYDKFTSILNLASIIMFIGGVVFFLIFTRINFIDG